MAKPNPLNPVRVVRTRWMPWREITMDEHEYQQLLAGGAIIEEIVPPVVEVEDAPAGVPPMETAPVAESPVRPTPRRRPTVGRESSD